MDRSHIHQGRSSETNIHAHSHLGQFKIPLVLRKQNLIQLFNSLALLDTVVIVLLLFKLQILSSTYANEKKRIFYSSESSLFSTGISSKGDVM